MILLIVRPTAAVLASFTIDCFRALSRIMLSDLVFIFFDLLASDLITHLVSFVLGWVRVFQEGALHTLGNCYLNYILSTLIAVNFKFWNCHTSYIIYHGYQIRSVSGRRLLNSENRW